MSIDNRGFKHFIQAEAAEFLQPHQVLYNATVTNITYSSSGVSVTLADGRKLEADYAICTFSLGVLQHDDVVFDPPLPDWKQEAIQSMVMVCLPSDYDTPRCGRRAFEPLTVLALHAIGDVHKDIPAIPS